MAKLTFQVLEGVDKGRIFRDVPTPVTIGREEGNLVRLNDERVSRYHAKVQQDQDDIILVDLDSTNGTQVNGTMVQIRRLRIGDRITVGRTQLLFGSTEEITARLRELSSTNQMFGMGRKKQSAAELEEKTLQALTAPASAEQDFDFDLQLSQAPLTSTPDALLLGTRALPPLPRHLTPSQAARLAEILELLHRGLCQATEFIEAKEDGTQVTLSFADWQRILAVQMLLARYQQAITDPEALNG